MRVKLTVGVVIAGVALLLSQTPAWAHHAFAAEFDANRPVKFPEAKVTRVQLINPHSWIHVEVKLPDGKTESWAIEAGSPNALLRRGLRQTDFPIGSELIIDGYRSKNGSSTANGTSVKFADGRNFFLGAASDETPAAPKR